MIKLQICCLIITLFIAAVYCPVKRVKSYSHIVFSFSLITSMVNIVFDMITVFTVNRLDTIPMSANRIFHTFFLGSMIMEVYLFYVYSVILIYDEKVKVKRMLFSAIPVWISWIALITLPIEYIQTNRISRLPGLDMRAIPKDFIQMDKVNYSWGPAVITVQGIVVFYFICIVVKLIKHGKDINAKKRYVITVAFGIEIVVLIFQSAYPPALITSMAITLINLAFFLTVESPDVLLMERLKEEKERADYANEAKSIFLSNMSHEIRTPMNAIVGMTDILLREDVSEEMREYLNNIKNSGDALLNIINDILDFSKIESGKLDIVEKKYEPMSMLHDLSMIFLNRIGSKPVELIYDVDPNLPAQLYGDNLRIRQIIINLVNNAIKFTEEGYVKLKVGVDSIGYKEIKLSISVEDSGQGIKEEDIEKLFKSFQQVDTKRNYKKEGTGLGLAISKQLVELMQGKIFVESTYGKGSCFSFYIVQKIVDEEVATCIKRELPENFRIGHNITNTAVREGLIQLAGTYGIECVDVSECSNFSDADIKIDFLITDDKKKAPKDSNTKICLLQNPMIENISDVNVTVINKPLYSLNFCQLVNEEDQVFVHYSEEKQKFTAPDAKILVVDDNEMNLKVARGLMSIYKVQIDTARDGEAAVEMVQDKQYDLVFMDHMMPVMDGIEATQTIRQMDEEYCRKLPIIALSANATADARKMFIEANMNDFVAKPIREKELEECLRKWLPKELLISTDGNEIPDTEDNEEEKVDSKLQGLRIEGIDFVEGIKNCGTSKFLLELMGDFYMMIDSKIDKLKTCLENGNLRDYTIEVHALKNNARMIGATELSKQFYRMEQLGNEENKEEIDNNLPALLELYTSYKQKLSELVNTPEEEKIKVSVQEIKAALSSLHDAVDCFDLDAADEAMKRLLTYDFSEEIKPMIDKLQILVADVAMEEIMELTEKIIEEIQE